MRYRLLYFRISFWATLVFISLLPTHLAAAGGYPLLFNYTYDQYLSEADLQNWDITQTDNGEIFIGNNNCMLRFDGYQWQKVSSYGDCIYRSVCAVGNRIYLGRHSEFGYLERNPFGDYTFTSLSAGKPVMQHDEEIWNIINLHDSIYFQSFNSLYCVIGDSVRTVSLPFSPLYMFSDSVHLYLQAMGGNFYQMDEEDSPHLLFSRNNIQNSDVVGFFPSSTAGEYTIVTSNSGIYNYTAGHLRKMKTEADNLLNSYAVNKAIKTKDGSIVLGTFRTGIICIGEDGKIRWHYHALNGLKNACVLRLMCDQSNNIWACMDDGVALIANGAPYRIFSSGTGGQSIGMVYSVCRKENKLLIATNQGVYRCEAETIYPIFELMPTTEGQNWHLTDIEGTLYCGQNSSLLKYENGQFNPVSGTNSSSTCIRKFQYNNEEYIIESGYSDLRLHKKEGTKWGEPAIIKGFSHPVRHFEIDNDGTIWAADMRIGIYHITLSGDLSQVEETVYYPEIDHTSARCFVMKMSGKVLFSNGQQIYRYDDATGNFEPYNKLNNCLPWTEGIVSITECCRGQFWIGSRTGYALMQQKGDSWKILRTIHAAALGCRSNEVAAQAYTNGTKTYFNLADAVLIYDTCLKQQPHDTPFFLHKLNTLNRRGEIVQLDVNQFKSGNGRVGDGLHLFFSYPSFPPNEVKYVFELQGRQSNIYQQSDRPELLLLRMTNGRKLLTAKVVAPDGTVLAQEQFRFRVIPPWYRSWWAIIGYLLLGFIIAQIFIKYQVRKKTERQRLQLLEQDRIISEQKQQLLEQELQIKSKDLASISLEAGLKDNVISSIRQAIREQQRKGTIAQGTFNAELLRIKQTTGNEKNWAVFQQNFDLIHEHFFRHLKEQYPELTTSDMRLCALLRLNMSTKDIATYTGLSVRGVESARFRLRKKLGLDAEQNLSEFLLSFK